VNVNTWQSKNRTILCFHVGFKLATLLIYLLNGVFALNFVMVFVLVVLLSAFDFWTVKNVSGRILVGLRWWNEVKDDGQTAWYFESKPVCCVI